MKNTWPGQTRLKILITILSLFFFVACNTVTTADDEAKALKNVEQREADNPESLHTTENAVDWHGVYGGSLEINGERQNVSLTLDLDNSWHGKFGAAGSEYNESGTFTWIENGSVVQLEGVEYLPGKFFVGENFISQLEKDGHRIMDDLDGIYTLTKK